MSAKVEFQKLLEGYVASYRAGDAAGCASCFASDAELYSPYGPAAIGKTAIEDIHRDWVVEGGENKKVDVVSAGKSGNTGWCLARFSEGKTGTGTSLSVLKRQPDGAWLITHCSLNEEQ